MRKNLILISIIFLISFVGYSKYASEKCSNQTKKSNDYKKSSDFFVVEERDYMFIGEGREIDVDIKVNLGEEELALGINFDLNLCND